MDEIDLRLELNDLKRALIALVIVAGGSVEVPDNIVDSVSLIHDRLAIESNRDGTHTVRVVRGGPQN